MPSLRQDLNWMLGGLAVALVDLRVQGLDLLPDPLGWTVAAAIAFRLGLHGARDRWGLVAGAGFLVAALLSVPTLVLDPGAATVFALPPDPLTRLALAQGLATDVGVVATLLALRDLARQRDDVDLADLARATAVALTVLAVLGPLVAVGVTLAPRAWPVAIPVAVAGFVAFVVAVVVVWRARRLAPPAPPSPDAPEAWREPI